MGLRLLAYLAAAVLTTGPVKAILTKEGSGSKSIRGGEWEGDGSCSCIGRKLAMEGASTLGRILSTCTSTEAVSSMTKRDDGSKPSALNMNLLTPSADDGSSTSNPRWFLHAWQRERIAAVIAG